jgi:hypothetical protein
LLLIAKFAWPLIPLAFYAIGSDDTSAPAGPTASERWQAEERLMARVATAGPEIERRLAQWLTAHDGLLFLREPADAIEPYTLHVLPAVTPWRASCGEIGLTVTVGVFRKDITETALERQCEELLTVLGREMLRLTATGLHDSPRKGKP